MPGGAEAVAHWPTRKYKKYRSYLTWVRRVESGFYDQPQEEPDDGTPSWRVERIGSEAPWEADSFQRP